MKQHKWSGLTTHLARALGLFLLLTSHATVAMAGKLVVSAGAYNFSVENQSNRVSASISGVGSYQISYRHLMNQNIELDFGFSLLATETFSGDLAFGVDIGVNYFPFTNAGHISAESGVAHMYLNNRWRPFVGGSFNQRNFQSTSSQYAGFGLKGGTEYQVVDDLCVHTTLRYLFLGGPNQASANQIDLLGGLVFQF